MYGKVIVAKAFLISKLNYVASILSVPSETVKAIQKHISFFVWNGPDKIKRKASFNTFDCGGLNLTHLTSWIKAQKLKWLRRFLDNEVKSGWKSYLNWLLKDKGGTFFLCSDFDLHCSTKDMFYREILGFWKELKHLAGVQTGKDIIWNNEKVRIDNKPVFYPEYRDLGIVFVSDLFKHNFNDFFQFGVTFRVEEEY